MEIRMFCLLKNACNRPLSAIVVVALLAIYDAVAQPTAYAYTAGLLSVNDKSSTARVRALGGGGVTLGGMMGAGMHNPAGLGFFRKHAFQISPQLNFYNSQLSRTEKTQEDHSIRPNVVSLGGVYSLYVGDIVESDFRGGSFMFSLTRTQDNFEKFTYASPNAQHSLLDYYAREAEGKSSHELLNDWQLAPLEAHQLLVATGDKSYRSLLSDQVAHQLERYKRKNTHYRLALGYGMNYKNKLYAGFSAAFGLLHYNRTRDYQESYDRVVRNILVSDKLRSRGESYQLGLGIIYRPISSLRVGLSLQAPTIYRIRERSNYDWSTNFDNYERTNKENEIETIDQLRYESGQLKSTYALRTPYHLHTGASYFFGTRGFVRGQLSWTNYRDMYIFSDDFNATDINQSIEDAYKDALNYYLGGELRVSPTLYLRAGYSYRNPSLDIRKATQHYTGGLGYQYEIFDLSLALEHMQGEESYAPFESAEVGTLETRSTLFLLTTTFFIYY